MSSSNSTANGGGIQKSALPDVVSSKVLGTANSFSYGTRVTLVLKSNAHSANHGPCQTRCTDRS